MSAVVEARGLVRSYPADGAPVRAVDGVDLAVEAGETVSVMGPSGCGKSTLLHLLGGLERPDAGEISLGGRAGRPVLGDRMVGVAPPHRRLRVPGVPPGRRADRGRERRAAGAARRRVAPGGRRRAMELLERLDVAERAGHLPDHLSGGEQQRVAVARALVNEPMVMLADEPTGNLDSRATGDILRLFAELGQAGQALLIVTHDARVASTADRLLTMRDGAIVAQTRLGAGTSVAGLLASLADLGGER